MNILVTGGAGFIASHIVDRYLDEGHKVMVIDSLASGKKENLSPQAELVELDITDKKIAEVIAKFAPEIVNHHAAQINVRTSVEKPIFDANINILGSLNLFAAIQAAGTVKKVVFASTGGAIYGDADMVPTNETYLPQPLSPYGIAKLSTEHYLNFYRHIHGIPFTALRYANVYGPRQNPHGEAGVVSIFFQRILTGQDFVINGEGTQTRDFVFVADVVEANMKATFSEHVGIFNIGTGVETSINKLVEQMKQALESTQTIAHGDGKAGEQQRSCLDATKARQTLGWEPQFDLRQGLLQTAAFFKAHA